MSLTKDEACELKSLIAMLVQSALVLHEAENSKAQAESRLEDWLLKQQYANKETAKEEFD